MINRIATLLGYCFYIEYYTYPRIDGTFYNQTKRSVEVFLNPFGLVITSKKKGKGVSLSIQKEVQDEFTIE